MSPRDRSVSGTLCKLSCVGQERAFGAIRQVGQFQELKADLPRHPVSTSPVSHFFPLQTSAEFLGRAIFYLILHVVTNELWNKAPHKTNNGSRTQGLSEYVPPSRLHLSRLLHPDIPRDGVADHDASAVL